MSDLPKSVSISELAPREGFQIENAVIPTADKIALIDALSTTGVRSIEVTSFVNPKKVPGTADAEAVVAGLKPNPQIAYRGVWFNRRGAERALATQRLEVTGLVRLYSSPTFLRRNLDRAFAEQPKLVRDDLQACRELGVPVDRAVITTAFGCNFEGDIPQSRIMDLLAQALDLAQAEGFKVKTLSLADTMAWGTPAAVKSLVGRIRSAYPDLDIHLHLHDTRGLGLANAFAGLEMGVSSFDTSVGGLGGCPFAEHHGAAGNVCTEDFVFMCEEMGIATGIDLERMIEAARLAERIVGHPLPGAVKEGGTLARPSQLERA